MVRKLGNVEFEKLVGHLGPGDGGSKALEMET